MNYQLPTQTTIIIGSSEQTALYSQRVLQTAWCTIEHENEESAAACFCRTCQKIKAHQHHNALWIAPEGNYTLDDIDLIFTQAQFALDNNHYTLLFEAHHLTHATANKLLKLLEEPPHYQYFILHTDNESAILPTILSRCTIVHLESEIEQISIEQHLLLKHFCVASRREPFAFEEALKQLALNDQQSLELAYELLDYYYQQVKKHTLNHENLNEITIDTQQELVTAIIKLLLERLRYPPQSGSSELFWKHLYVLFMQRRASSRV